MFTRTYSEAEHPLHVARVSHGRLATESGVVFAPDGRLVRESLWDDEHYNRLFSRPPRLAKATPLGGRHASIMSLWCRNYFHWLFNALPRIAVLRASGVEWDSLIVPEKLTAFQRETLARLGFADDKLTPFTREHVEVEELIWVAPLSPFSEPSTFLLDWVKGSLSVEAPEPFRKLYVSRQGTRRATNEAEVFRMLEPLGYEFMIPEQLSFDEQVKVFAETRVAVGPHGSNFVNGIFSRKLSVLEFYQPAHVDWGVYTVLCASGAEHWNCICEPVRNGRSRKFDDMIIPIDLLLESLERMEI
jgi:capsular polysaccharide biosynthesis protein